MTRRNLIVSCGLAAVLFASMHGSALAVDRFWSNAAGGNFATPANWTGGVVAGPADLAIFDLSSAAGYTVNLTAPRQVNEMDVRHDRVTLNLGGSTLDVAGRTRIGRFATDDARLVVRSGLLESQEVSIGEDFNSQGELRIVGSDARLDVVGDLYVGSWGNGQFLVLEGADVTSNWANIANVPEGIGQAVVSGAGSTWVVETGALGVGVWGLGGLTVADGGRVDVATNWAIVGWTETGTGHATITGPGSLLTSDGALVVGEDGQGDVLVSGGGRVETRNNWGLIGNRSTGVGRVEVTGVGSEMDIHGDLQAGGFGHGELRIADGGLVTVGTWGNVGAEAGSFGQVEVTGANSRWHIGDALVVGNGGMGHMQIRDGGHVSQLFDGLIGDQGTGSGSVRVEGTNSLWDVGGSLSLGRIGGLGELHIGSGGRVDVGAETYVYRGTVELAGGVLATDFVRLNNNSTLRGHGLVVSPFDGGFDTEIVAAGGKLTVGDSSVTWGFTQQGTIEIQSDATLELLDADQAFVGANITLDNGVLVARNGVAPLAGGIAMIGHGVVVGTASSFVMVINTPTGRVDLTTPIDVGSSTARVYSYGIADLGVQTTLAGGRLVAASGVRLGQDDFLSGAGTVTGNVRLENGILHAGSGQSLAVVGAVTGHGVLIGTIDEVSLGAPDGAVNLLAGIDVGGQTAQVHSAGPAGLGAQSTLAGGTIVAPSGLIVDAGQRIAGHGNITGNVALAGGAVGGNGTLNIAGSLSGHGLLYGTVVASTATPSNESIAIAGDDWSIGGDEVTAFSQAVLRLPARTTIGGGILRSAAGVLLTNDSRLEGFGTINGPVSATLGSRVVATGPLTLGDATSSVGVNLDGHLEVRGNLVTLRDANTAVVGASTTIGSGASSGTLSAAAGLTIGFGRNVSGHGTVSTPNVATVPLVNNGAIRGNSPAQPITLPGFVKGVGTLENVMVTGTLSPGLSPTITDATNLAFGQNSRLVMELGGLAAGTQYDQLRVAGTLALDGTLDVRLIDGFSPSLGNQFVLATYDTRIGMFDHAVYPPTGVAGASWMLSYGAHSLMLTLATSQLPGDIDLDGDVDRTDAARFSQFYGRTSLSVWSTGDFNADGRTTLADWGMLQAHFGQPGMSPAGVAVPEPSGMALVFGMAVVVAWFRRSRRANSFCR